MLTPAVVVEAPISQMAIGTSEENPTVLGAWTWPWNTDTRHKYEDTTNQKNRICGRDNVKMHILMHVIYDHQKL